MEEKVVVIKLTTGTELIAFDGGLGPQNKRVLNYAIETVTYADGSVGFAPFIPAAKTQVLHIEKHLIAFDGLEPQVEMEETYRQTVVAIKQQESGVVVPNKPNIEI